MLKLLEYFIPQHLKSNARDLMRCYIFVGILIANSAICAVLLFGLSTLGFFASSSTQSTIALLLIAALPAANLFILMKLKHGGNYRSLTNIMMLIMLVSAFTGIQITGGFHHSPALQLLVICPLTSFLLNGLRDGIYWLILTAALSLISFTLSSPPEVSASLLQDKYIKPMYTYLHFVIFLMTGFALLIYELINQNLKQLLHTETSKFKHESRHDNLTGAPNRLEFFRQLNIGTEDADNRNEKLALLYIDLDGFKRLNDQHGHHAGDKLLIEVTKRLNELLRTSDTVARLGGDEFAIILPGILSIANIDTLTQKILAAIREPVHIHDSLSITSKGSIGIAIYPDDTTDTSTLCRHADTAMYYAKQSLDTAVYFNENFKFKENRDDTTLDAPQSTPDADSNLINLLKDKPEFLDGSFFQRATPAASKKPTDIEHI